MNKENGFPGGVWPVMLTPFLDNGEIDETGLRALTEFYIGSGVRGLFAACQSSEIFHLNLEERLKIARITVETARGRVPVIASGNTSETLEEQARELREMAALGVDAVVLLSNRLAKQDEGSEVWIENLHRLLEQLEPALKLGMYECPYPYKRVLAREELQAMIDSGRFYFVKDTSCDAALIRERIEQLRGTKLKLFNANTTTLLETLRAGADGYCGVMANFHPELYVWLSENLNSENAEPVSRLLSICALIERQLYPVNAKWSLSRLRGVPISDYSRVQDCAGLTETYQKEVRNMEALVRQAYRMYCT